MGLVSIEDGTVSIANPIYREVIIRVLSEEYQLMIPAPEFKWQKSDGSLDLDALMAAFQRFWAKHADTWELKADYTEAFPHLLLMAFLQRVTNSKGQIEREYAAGRGRVDIAIQYNDRWDIIEIKLVHVGESRDSTIEEGLEQISHYRDRINPSGNAFLVIFDRTEAGRKKSWQERLTQEKRCDAHGRDVIVIGA